MKMPESGVDKSSLFNKMSEVRDNDIKWKEGKAFSLVFNGGEEITEIIKEAYTMFFSENGLNPSAFPSLKKFENEVVQMTGSLLNGVESAGNMTSGGTESILMAIKTAREWARANKPEIKEPELIMPKSAHPAFNKGGHYFGVKIITIPTKSDYRADVEAMEKAITKNTIMLVGSAPSYPQKIINPIKNITTLTKKNNLLIHINTCINKIILPFYKKLNTNIPSFNFSINKITNISINLHKYKYTTKNTNIILYKNKTLKKYQFYITTN